MLSSCFLRRPQKLMKSSLTIWHLLHNVKLTVKILSIFVAFLENMNFNLKRVETIFAIGRQMQSRTFLNWCQLIALMLIIGVCLMFFYERKVCKYRLSHTLLIFFHWWLPDDYLMMADKYVFDDCLVTLWWLIFDDHLKKLTKVSFLSDD